MSQLCKCSAQRLKKGTYFNEVQFLFIIVYFYLYHKLYFAFYKHIVQIKTCALLICKKASKLSLNNFA